MKLFTVNEFKLAAIATGDEYVIQSDEIFPSSGHVNAIEIAVTDNVNGLTFRLDGSTDGDITVSGLGSVHTVRSGTGRGDATRAGSGKGNAYRTGEGPGNAWRLGSGDGDAIKSGPGAGNAWRRGRGFGRAIQR